MRGGGNRRHREGRKRSDQKDFSIYTNGGCKIAGEVFHSTKTGNEGTMLRKQDKERTKILPSEKAKRATLNRQNMYKASLQTGKKRRKEKRRLILRKGGDPIGRYLQTKKNGWDTEKKPGEGRKEIKEELSMFVVRRREGAERGGRGEKKAARPKNSRTGCRLGAASQLPREGARTGRIGLSARTGRRARKSRDGLLTACHAS